MDWQPIETAPKDGRAILIILSNGRECVAEYWDGPPEHPDWGGWAHNAMPSFCRGTMREDADAKWIGWRPLSE